MKIYKLSPILIRFMTGNMSNRKRKLSLSHNQSTIKTRSISIKNGIFQGDSLSPLLFCLSLAPISTMLNNTQYRYEVGGKKISHLSYMDDLKTYVKTTINRRDCLRQSRPSVKISVCSSALKSVPKPHSRRVNSHKLQTPE